MFEILLQDNDVEARMQDRKMRWHAECILMTGNFQFDHSAASYCNHYYAFY